MSISLIDEWTKHEEAVLSDYIQIIEAIQTKSVKALEKCTTISKRLLELLRAFILITTQEGQGSSIAVQGTDVIVPWLSQFS
jgi:hypothetical protein